MAQTIWKRACLFVRETQDSVLKWLNCYHNNRGTIPTTSQCAALPLVKGSWGPFGDSPGVTSMESPRTGCPVLLWPSVDHMGQKSLGSVFVSSAALHLSSGAEERPQATLQWTLEYFWWLPLPHQPPPCSLRFWALNSPLVPLEGLSCPALCAEHTTFQNSLFS